MILHSHTISVHFPGSKIYFPGTGLNEIHVVHSIRLETENPATIAAALARGRNDRSPQLQSITSTGPTSSNDMSQAVDIAQPRPSIPKRIETMAGMTQYILGLGQGQET